MCVCVFYLQLGFTFTSQRQISPISNSIGRQLLTSRVCVLLVICTTIIHFLSVCYAFSFYDKFCLIQNVQKQDSTTDTLVSVIARLYTSL